MSDESRGAPVEAAEGEAPINPYSLLEAVNDSSDTVHTGWLIFIAIMSYVLVAVAGVSHKDLLLARDIPLPILQVGIGLTRFFLFAPIVIVLFHMGVITQLVMLARKALELDKALRMIEATDRRTHPLRLELHNFFFVQAIAGPERSRVVNGLLHGLSWLTLVALPLLLLVYIQLTFLPYHDVDITWAHRIALLADIALLVLIGVFLTRPEQSLAQAMWRAILSHPLTVLATILVLSSVAAFSFLVATVPGERLDAFSRRQLASPSAGAFGGAPATYGFVVPFLDIAPEGKLLGMFERNLNVTDLDLVVDKDVTPGEPTVSLRRRDLRHARLDRTDLHQADLTGANLDGASLVGADLRGALMHCADVSLLLLAEDRRAAVCPSARGANLSRARLGEASLAGIDLGGARLEETDLTGANLAHANLAGANLYSARLERADLTGGVMMLGANLATAALQGADLTGAKLDGADLTSAGLQAAILDFAGLAGASLRDADLEGASLYQAQLPGANLSGASIRGASLREAWTWRTSAPEASGSSLADLTELRTVGPAKAEALALDASLKRLGEVRLEARLREALGDILAAGDGKPPIERTAASVVGSTWPDVVRASLLDGPEVRAGEPPPAATAAVATGAIPTVGGETAATMSQPPLAFQAAGQLRGTDRKSRLTRHLVSLACKPRWASGAVATGLALRALGPAFNGDAAGLYEGLRRPDCAGGKQVPARVMGQLGGLVEAVVRAK